LLHARVKPEVGDQLSAGEKPARVADGGDERRGADHVQAGHGHQPADLRPGEGLLGDQFLHGGDLRVEELDVAHPGVDGLALLKRQLQSGEPLTALHAEQIRDRRLGLQPALQRRVDLVLRAGARADQLLTARQPTAQDPAALIGHPYRLELTPPQQTRQRSRVELVRLRSRARDPGVIRAHHDHPVNVRLENPRHLPAATRHLKRDPV
jgi:hypothetical protein